MASLKTGVAEASTPVAFAAGLVQRICGGVVSPAGVTVMYTCAGRLVDAPLLTLKVKLSAPVKFSIGV